MCTEAALVFVSALMRFHIFFSPSTLCSFTLACQARLISAALFARISFFFWRTSCFTCLVWAAYAAVAAAAAAVSKSPWLLPLLLQPMDASNH